MEKDTCFTEVDLKQEKFEDVREEGEKFHCNLCDKEMVHKISLILLEGLSITCVDNTTGDIFKSPGTVAADIRKEMLEYLTQRSQSFVADTLLLEGHPEEEIADQPSDIISDFIEDFTDLKRNLLSRVSGWLLSESRDDKIDDFVQEMELNSFWLLDRREAVAQTLLRNVDYKNEYHCSMIFKTEVDLEHHRLECGFRTLLCENEGCSSTFSASHAGKHDFDCPFKILPCEQNCPEILIRREMDKHCITVCPMKPINCPFYSIGCKARIPTCNVQQHFSDEVHSHLLLALQYLHKGASVSLEDLEPRVERIEQESSDRLAGMQGVRSFTNAVKDLDAKLGLLSIKKQDVANGEDTKKSDTESSLVEDKNKLSSEESAANKPLETNSGEHIIVGAEESLTGEPPAVETKETSSRELPKESNTEEPPSEPTKKSEKALGEDTIKSDCVKPPTEDAKGLDGEPPTADKRNPVSEENSTENTKKFEELKI